MHHKGVLVKEIKKELVALLESNFILITLLKYLNAKAS